MKKMLSTAVAVLLASGVAASAATLKISATSAVSGDLGYFVVDEAVLVADADKRLFASQFEDFSFVAPVSGDVFDPTTVLADTGTTIFGLVGGIWTVTGGAGSSLATATSDFYVAGTFYVSFTSSREDYRDVSWSTETIASVPLPASGVLLVLALGGLAGMRRKASA